MDGLVIKDDSGNIVVSDAPKWSARYSRESEELEFELLKQFFSQWERLHTFKGAKDLQMQCAQDLVETAHNIRNLRADDGTQK